MQLTRTHTHTHTCHLSVECVILYFRCSKFRTTTPRFFLFPPPPFFFYFFTRVAQLPLLLVSQRTSLLHLLRPVSFYFCCFSCKSATRRSRSSRWFFPIWPFIFLYFFFFERRQQHTIPAIIFISKTPRTHTIHTHTHTLTPPFQDSNSNSMPPVMHTYLFILECVFCRNLAAHYLIYLLSI